MPRFKLMNNETWYINGMTFTDYANQFHQYCPEHIKYLNNVISRQELNFIHSETDINSWDSKKKEVVPVFPQSFHDIWIDYVTSFIYIIMTKKYREENNLSLLNGKDVKQIDRYGETVLKDLKNIVEGKN